MCQSVSLNNPTTMELSLVTSIFSAFVIFEAILTIAESSQTTRKQCKPNEVSNAINPCTCRTFLCECIKAPTKEEVKNYYVNVMRNMEYSFMNRYVKVLHKKGKIQRWSSPMMMFFTHAIDLFEFVSDLSRIYENIKIPSSLLGSIDDVLDEVFAQPLDQSIYTSDISAATKFLFTFVGEVIAARHDESGSVDGSQLFSNNRIDLLQMFTVHFSLVRKYIVYGYQRDKSSKYGMCLMTETVTHSTQLVRSQSQHASIINNGSNTNIIGDINGTTTSQTGGNISASNTPQFGNISNTTRINNDVPELDIGSADNSGTRFKANIDYKDRNKQNRRERRYSLSKLHRSNTEPFESQRQNAKAAALTKKTFMQGTDIRVLLNDTTKCGTCY